MQFDQRDGVQPRSSGPVRGDVAAWAALLVVAMAASVQAAVQDLEIVVWPHQHTDRLGVAEGTVQPFYVMAYDRRAAVEGETEIRVRVPAHWQVWDGRQPPPASGTDVGDGSSLTYQAKPIARAGRGESVDYRPRHASVHALLVVRALEQAASGILHLEWWQGDRLLAKHEIRLDLVPLGAPIAAADGQPAVGMWVNNPHFDERTNAEVFRSLRRAGVDYVMLSPTFAEEVSEPLAALEMKVLMNQWWGFREYMPEPPGEEAYSVMRDGSISRSRWSPTYMAEGGPMFVEGVERIVESLAGMDGTYGLMLDYEPGREGIEADYSEASRAAFERYLGAEVSAWPEDVLEGGRLEEPWISFRNLQSLAYVQAFQRAIRQRAPHLKLAVSTSGASGRPDDINRRLAVTDITLLSHGTDTIHPQLYSWTSQMPGQQERFLEKLDLGVTTVQQSPVPVYTALGSAAGARPAADPRYLHYQTLYWWMHGAAGVEVWQYYYGVDGYYLAMLQAMARLIHEERRAGGSTPLHHLDAVAGVEAPEAVEVLGRRSHDGRFVWLGLFNAGNEAAEIKLVSRGGYAFVRAEDASHVLEPWTAAVVCLVRAER